MLFKSEVMSSIFMFIFLHSATVTSLSLNQPKFCPNASWNVNGSIFATAQVGFFDIFIDTNNTVYTTTQDNNQIQVWSSQGGTLIRNISNNLNSPGSIFATSNGDIYVGSDSDNNLSVQLWTSNATNGIIVMDVTAQCMGLFVDTNDTLYCAASDNHQVVAKSLNGNSQATSVIAGNGFCGSTANQLCDPNGIFVDINFNLYIADWSNNRIQKFQLGETNGQTVAGDGATGTIDLKGPTGVVLDADGYLFIADDGNKRIVGSDLNGFRCIVGCSQTSSSVLSIFGDPRSIKFDSFGNLFIADHVNNRIFTFTLATNSCSQAITSTTNWMTTVLTTSTMTTISTTSTMTTKAITSWAANTTIITLQYNSTTTSNQMHSSFERVNGLASYLSLCLIIVVFELKN